MSLLLFTQFTQKEAVNSFPRRRRQPIQRAVGTQRCSVHLRAALSRPPDWSSDKVAHVYLSARRYYHYA